MERYSQIFNKLIWSRFFARQIDLFIVHLVSFLVYSYLSEYYVLNPLLIFISLLIINQSIEAILIYKLKMTIGKFCLGLRVYPKSLKDNFKRSYLVYLKGLALGFPILGWLFMLITYFQSMNSKPEWDKFGEVVQSKDKLIKGLILLLVINIGIMFILHYPNKEDTIDTSSQIIETIVVDYDEITPEGNISKSDLLWTKSCMYGALSYAQTKNEQLDVNLLSFSCKEAGKFFKNETDDPKLTYLKGCGAGINIGSQAIYGDLEDSELEGKEKEILKQICIPNVDF